MSTQAFLSSAQQYIHLLKEKDNSIKQIALDKLIEIVDNHWAEISEHLGIIEELYENNQFAYRHKAAFVASKVYFHLEEYEESLNLALNSKEYFDLQQNSQYVECLATTAIDKYMLQKQQIYDNKANVEVDTKYEALVEKLFAKQLENNEYKQVLGVAVECRRLDVIETVLKQDVTRDPNSTDVLSYLYEISIQIVSNRRFRDELLRILTRFYNNKQKDARDYSNLSQCYYFLADHEGIAKLLFQLVQNEEDEESKLVAYQISMDISENDNQYVVNNIISSFPIENNNDYITQQREKIVKLLNGTVRQQLNLNFLRNNKRGDPQVVLKVKNGVDVKKSVAHGAVLYANSFFNSATKDDSFLKDNFDWVKKANHWSKFSATASLGVIHRGDHKNGMSIFKDYLPGSNNQNPNFYSNGGALYGLGFVHLCNKNQEVINYFAEIVRNPTYNGNEQIVHGAALGLGLTSLASEDEVIFQILKDILDTNQAVTGEAAALAIGLVMAGSANEMVIQELVKFAQDTDHEKIIRSIGLALSIVLFQKEDKADTLIEQLTLEKDAILRYAGCLVIGMAYIGTANNNAIRKLLHFAVDDVSDEVRRAAVLSLAFVMFKQYDQMPKLMKLLALSYNPHVRYGTALALGIACAGTQFKEALDMLEPLLNDTTDFVRQGAYIGMAMVLQQTNGNVEPRTEKFKKQVDEVISNKREDILVKLGAVLATGILESGGRNSIISLASSQGFPKLSACVGMVVFTHFWYWFPLIHFFNLTLTPCAIIGVNDEFNIPKSFEYKVNCKQSLFDYPPLITNEEKKDNAPKAVAQLSITTKAKARAQRKHGKDNEGDGEAGNLSRIMSSQQASQQIQSMEIEKDQNQEEKKEQKKEEPAFYIQSNPSRVLEKQKKYIQYVENRYTPILKERKNGIIFLKDSKKGDPEEFVGEVQASPAQQQAQQPVNQQQQQQSQGQEQFNPPEDFVFDENIQK